MKERDKKRLEIIQRAAAAKDVRPRTWEDLKLDTRRAWDTIMGLFANGRPEQEYPEHTPEEWQQALDFERRMDERVRGMSRTQAFRHITEAVMEEARRKEGE